MILAMRDATAVRHRHGRASRYHVKVDEDGRLLGWFDDHSILAPGYGYAACDRRLLLVETTEVGPAEVASLLICTRPGCAAHVENYLSRVDGYDTHDDVDRPRSRRLQVDPRRLPVATLPCDKVCRDPLSLAKGHSMPLQHVTTHRTVQLGKIWLEHEFFQNPRQFTGLEEEKIEAIGKGIKDDGLDDPPKVQKVKLANGDIIDLAIDGQRRIKGMLEKLPKNTEIPVIDLTEDPIELDAETGERLVDIALKTLKREGLSSYELLAVAIRRKARGQTLDVIADKIDMSKSWVSRMLTAWGNASDKLKLEWRKGNLTDEQFKDLAEVKDPEKQVENAKAVVAARKSGDKSEARVLAKENKETARAAKAAPATPVKNGVNHKAGPLPAREQREMFADDKKPAPEPVADKKPAPPKMVSRLALEELLAMADKRPPTADYVKGIMDCARYVLGVIEPNKFAKAWNQYVSRIQGVPRPVKKAKPVKLAAKAKPTKAKAKKGAAKPAKKKGKR